LILGGALRGRPAPVEGVAEKKRGEAPFLWSVGETSPLVLSFDFDFAFDFLYFDFDFLF